MVLGLIKKVGIPTKEKKYRNRNTKNIRTYCHRKRKTNSTVRTRILILNFSPDTYFSSACAQLFKKSQIDLTAQ